MINECFRSYSDHHYSLDEAKDKRENLSPNPSSENPTCASRLFPSAQTTPITTTTHSRQSISSTTESGKSIDERKCQTKHFHLVESMCAVTEENNKKNVTSECSEQRIILYVVCNFLELILIE